MWYRTTLIQTFLSFLEVLRGPQNTGQTHTKHFLLVFFGCVKSHLLLFFLLNKDLRSTLVKLYCISNGPYAFIFTANNPKPQCVVIPVANCRSPRLPLTLSMAVVMAFRAWYDTSPAWSSWQFFNVSRRTGPSIWMSHVCEPKKHFRKKGINTQKNLH